MTGSIMVESLGDSPNLRIMGFLLENPFDEYSISDIATLADVNRATAKKYIDEYHKKGYIKTTGNVNKKYKTNLKNSTMRYLQVFIDAVGSEYFRKQYEIPQEHLYIECLELKKRSALVVAGA